MQTMECDLCEFQYTILVDDTMEYKCCLGYDNYKNKKCLNFRPVRLNKESLYESTKDKSSIHTHRGKN